MPVTKCSTILIDLIMKIIIQIILVAISLFFAYKIYQSISEPTKFNQEKIERYQVVVDKLKELRTAQLAHLELRGNYTQNYDSLIYVIENGKFAITQRRDTSYPDVERNRAFGLDPYTGGYYKEEVVIDTLGFKSVKDSLFRAIDYKNLHKVMVKGKEIPVQLQAGYLEMNERKVPVFEASVSKDDILHGMNRDLIIAEKNVMAVDGINGDKVVVGSMENISTNGNWPVRYDGKKE